MIRRDFLKLTALAITTACGLPLLTSASKRILDESVVPFKNKWVCLLDRSGKEIKGGGYRRVRMTEDSVIFPTATSSWGEIWSFGVADYENSLPFVWGDLACKRIVGMQDTFSLNNVKVIYD